jgi:hypothetical protein
MSQVKTAVLILMLTAIANSVWGLTVTVIMSRSASVPDMGYRIYWAEQEDADGDVYDCGEGEVDEASNEVKCSIANFPAGKWYFTATTYVGSYESPRSNTVYVEVPAAPTTVESFTIRIN